MDKEILIEHYNNKYAHEKNNEALDLIPYKKHPIH